jgi:hypothetical protein
MDIGGGACILDDARRAAEDRQQALDQAVINAITSSITPSAMASSSSAVRF